MTDLMVDIETLSTEKNAAILSIAAVPFITEPEEDDDSGHPDCPWFYAKIGLEQYDSPPLVGEFHISGQTLLWWMKQSEKARNEAFLTGTRKSLYAACDELRTYIERLPQPVKFWAKAPDFDATILAHAFGVFSIPVPWKFFNQRDVRTAVEMGGNIKIDREGEHHDALDDCQHQIREVQAAYAAVKKRKVVE
jgi:hypothetical protein